MATDIQPREHLPKLVVMDEASRFFGIQDDELREKLREIEGIPNASYLVRDGQVFVFDKLLQLVKEQIALQPDQQVNELALSLVDAATVPALEAIEEWGVVPEAFEVKTSSPNSFAIHHRYFEAALPGAFVDKAAVHHALATLIMGGTVPGAGEFSYRGQEMSLSAPLGLELLPVRPDIEAGSEPTFWIYSSLADVEFEEGFSPVTKDLFEEIKSREWRWRESSAQAARQVHARAGEVWAKVSLFPLEELNEPGELVDSDDREAVAQLRECFPELAKLSDATLFSWFDSFQRECCFIGGWSAERDDGFLFYLLGGLVERHDGAGGGQNAGEWVAYEILRGGSPEAAMCFGKACQMYNDALIGQAARMADAMRFLGRDKAAVDLRGAPITTMRDMFRYARKVSTGKIDVVQSLGDVQS